QAFHNRIPLVCIVNQHPTLTEEKGAGAAAGVSGDVPCGGTGYPVGEVRLEALWCEGCGGSSYTAPAIW
ncbi:MAG: hypothetical protein AAB270_00995, partial [Chloroflexota bacterium]